MMTWDTAKKKAKYTHSSNHDVYIIIIIIIIITIISAFKRPTVILPVKYQGSYCCRVHDSTVMHHLIAKT
jgi:hypothetical protein